MARHVAAVTMTVAGRGLAVVAAVFALRHLAVTIRSLAFHRNYLRYPDMPDIMASCISGDVPRCLAIRGRAGRAPATGALASARTEHTAFDDPFSAAVFEHHHDALAV